jgi:hypothetical protein
MLETEVRCTAWKFQVHYASAALSVGWIPEAAQ